MNNSMYPPDHPQHKVPVLLNEPEACGSSKCSNRTREWTNVRGLMIPCCSAECNQWIQTYGRIRALMCRVHPDYMGIQKVPRGPKKHPNCTCESYYEEKAEQNARARSPGLKVNPLIGKKG